MNPNDPLATANPDECWLFAGFIEKNGYGRLLKSVGAPGAHRVMYENEVGQIPEGLHLDHLCRVRHCINPAHLEPVTWQENIRRGAQPWSSRTHCKNGHEFNDQNTLHVVYKGWNERKCRPCNTARAREYRRQKRELINRGER